MSTLYDLLSIPEKTDEHQIEINNLIEIVNKSLLNNSNRKICMFNIEVKICNLVEKANPFTNELITIEQSLRDIYNYPGIMELMLLKNQLNTNIKEFKKYIYDDMSKKYKTIKRAIRDIKKEVKKLGGDSSRVTIEYRKHKRREKLEKRDQHDQRVVKRNTRVKREQRERREQRESRKRKQREQRESREREPRKRVVKRNTRVKREHDIEEDDINKQKTSPSPSTRKRKLNDK
jgi:hypothetical protein